MATVPDEKAPMNTVAELLDRLGGVPPGRIRLQPPPGQATERDVVKIHDREDRLCELIDGVLVEKPMGARESLLAMALGHFLHNYLEKHPLGIVLGEGGILRFMKGLVRIPDVCFISWERLPEGEFPEDPIPDLVPDLAVEVLSKTNTRKEMQRKLTEYFLAGVRLVWMIQPKSQTAEIYRTPTNPKRLDIDDTLLGEDVLPGFSLSLKEFFASSNLANRKPKKP